MEQSSVTCAECNKKRETLEPCECGSTMVLNTPNADRLVETMREIKK